MARTQNIWKNSFEIKSWYYFDNNTEDNIQTLIDKFQNRQDVAGVSRNERFYTLNGKKYPGTKIATYLKQIRDLRTNLSRFTREWIKQHGKSKEELKSLVENAYGSDSQADSSYKFKYEGNKRKILNILNKMDDNLFVLDSDLKVLIRQYVKSNNAKSIEDGYEGSNIVLAWTQEAVRNGAIKEKWQDVSDISPRLFQRCLYELKEEGQLDNFSDLPDFPDEPEVADSGDQGQDQQAETEEDTSSNQNNRTAEEAPLEGDGGNEGENHEGLGGQDPIGDTPTKPTDARVKPEEATDNGPKKVVDPVEQVELNFDNKHDYENVVSYIRDNLLEKSNSENKFKVYISKTTDGALHIYAVGQETGKVVYLVQDQNESFVKRTVGLKPKHWWGTFLVVTKDEFFAQTQTAMFEFGQVSTKYFAVHDTKLSNEQKDLVRDTQEKGQNYEIGYYKGKKTIVEEIFDEKIRCSKAFVIENTNLESIAYVMHYTDAFCSEVSSGRVYGDKETTDQDWVTYFGHGLASKLSSSEMKHYMPYSISYDELFQKGYDGKRVTASDLGLTEEMEKYCKGIVEKKGHDDTEILRIQGILLQYGIDYEKIPSFVLLTEAQAKAKGNNIVKSSFKGDASVRFAIPEMKRKISGMDRVFHTVKADRQKQAIKDVICEGLILKTGELLEKLLSTRRITEKINQLIDVLRYDFFKNDSKIVDAFKEGALKHVYSRLEKVDLLSTKAVGEITLLNDIVKKVIGSMSDGKGGRRDLQKEFQGFVFEQLQNKAIVHIKTISDFSKDVGDQDTISKLLNIADTVIGGKIENVKQSLIDVYVYPVLKTQIEKIIKSLASDLDNLPNYKTVIARLKLVATQLGKEADFEKDEQAQITASSLKIVKNTGEESAVEKVKALRDKLKSSKDDISEFYTTILTETIKLGENTINEKANNVQAIMDHLFAIIEGFALTDAFVYGKKSYASYVEAFQKSILVTINALLANVHTIVKYGLENFAPLQKALKTIKIDDSTLNNIKEQVKEEAIWNALDSGAKKFIDNSLSSTEPVQSDVINALISTAAKLEKQDDLKSNSLAYLKQKVANSDNIVNILAVAYAVNRKTEYIEFALGKLKDQLKYALYDFDQNSVKDEDVCAYSFGQGLVEDTFVSFDKEVQSWLAISAAIRKGKSFKDYAISQVKPKLEAILEGEITQSDVTNATSLVSILKSSGCNKQDAYVREMFGKLTNLATGNDVVLFKVEDIENRKEIVSLFNELSEEFSDNILSQIKSNISQIIVKYGKAGLENLLAVAKVIDKDIKEDLKTAIHEEVLKDQVNASDAKALFEVINVDKDGIEESESDSSETDESTDTSGESGNEDKNDDDTSFDDDADESDSDGDNDENQETDPSNVDRTEQEIDYSYACVDHNIHNVTNEKHPYYCDPMLSWLKSDHALYDNGSVSIIIEGSGFMCDASHERVYGEHKGYLCTDEITGDL
ncbi:MAG: hypothetical protein HRU36_05435 [Rickettsiales bacterium]|nr:hypothetical protein [Rickettsiales bacterium]